MTSPDERTAAVKALALEAGFARVGIAPAGCVPDGEDYRRWLRRGGHASMDYLARHVEKRLRPDRLVPGARSVICLAASYAPGETDAPDALGLARYARGRDYHKVLRRRCRKLMDAVRRVEPSFEGRAFVDSAPVLERSLARRAGIGWIGRNRCLIAPDLGSYVLLCEVVCNLPLRPDDPLAGGCEQCGACIEACPTGALSGAGLDASRCISYLTVEHRGPIDRDLWPLVGRRVVGCDACQEACPHNRGIPSGDPALRAADWPLAGAGLADVLAWTPAAWDAATRGSAARRVRLEMFVRNAAIAAGNSAGSPDAADLAAALADLPRRRPDLRDLAAWAMGRLFPTPPSKR